ncbi:hypothetical protein CLV36_10225 [Laceyella sediminis]|uniref:Helix-turn-helix protein n=1 Tax=Laceyella sediminis TaxID=573074 RepID=A0ABX5ES55_9BACL|nr:hypothetical protein [Laceyella sediminis]PRZ16317.1 hypothetical protein CLV36_10225 [Laceyella sediminis]
MEKVIYAGDKTAMKELSLFESIDQFNKYYRRLKLTIISELRPTWVRILDKLFQCSAELIGVTFFRRMELATRAECGKTSLDDFLRYARKRGFLRTVRAQSPKGGKKKSGGDAHLIFVFVPMDDLLELPGKNKRQGTNNESKREPHREPSFGSRQQVENPCESKDDATKSASLSSSFFSRESINLKTDINVDGDLDETYADNTIPKEVIRALVPISRKANVINRIWSKIRLAFKNSHIENKDVYSLDHILAHNEYILDQLVRRIKAVVNAEKTGKARDFFALLYWHVSQVFQAVAEEQAAAVRRSIAQSYGFGNFPMRRVFS